MTSLALEDMSLEHPYGELVRRLLKMFGLDYMHQIKEHKSLKFGWFDAHIGFDAPSQTYLMWCTSPEEDTFFKLADYQLLNCWDDVAEKALKTIKDQMVLDDLASV